MFKHPALLLLFLIYIPLVAWYIWKWRNSSPSMGVSTTSAFSGIRSSWKVWLMHLCFALQACRDWRVDCCLGSTSDTRFAAYIQS